jgi:uncharacterized membrane protein YoaK (UPF0700 family)
MVLTTRRFLEFLRQDIAEELLLECQLIALTFSVGINDSATYADLHTFVSNQTGNTIFLAVGALGISQKLVNLDHVGFGLGGFFAGAAISGQLANHFGAKKRFWLIFTNFFQTICIYASAGLRHWYVGEDTDPRSYGVIFLLSFGAGLQVSMARAIGIPEYPTGMITSSYIDFFNDPYLLHLHNRKRNRRVGAVGGLLVGAFIGAVGLRYEGPAFSQLLAALVKTLVTFSFFFNNRALPPRCGGGPENKTSVSGS